MESIFERKISFTTSQVWDSEKKEMYFAVSELFWSEFYRIRTEYGKIRSICLCSLQMWKNADQNNSEYGHFLRSIY